MFFIVAVVLLIFLPWPWNLVGSVREVVEPLMPDGQIRVLGGLWQADAAELPLGAQVRVTKVEGLALEVVAADGAAARAGA